jgi:hypothetical protein
MIVDYTLDAEDIASARLLALGIRPRLEFLAFAVAMAAMLVWSVSPWSYNLLPLLIGLTACLGGFRLTQIGKVRQAASEAFRRNPTLRQVTSATWNDRGVTIHPSAAPAEEIPWVELKTLKENERIVLLHGVRNIHAIPKRAFADKDQLAALRRLAGARIKPR